MIIRELVETMNGKDFVDHTIESQFLKGMCKFRGWQDVGGRRNERVLHLKNGYVCRGLNVYQLEC